MQCEEEGPGPGAPISRSECGASGEVGPAWAPALPTSGQSAVGRGPSLGPGAPPAWPVVFPSHPGSFTFRACETLCHDSQNSTPGCSEGVVAGYAHQLQLLLLDFSFVVSCVPACLHFTVSSRHIAASRWRAYGTWPHHVSATPRWLRHGSCAL